MVFFLFCFVFCFLFSRTTYRVVYKLRWAFVTKGARFKLYVYIRYKCTRAHIQKCEYRSVTIEMCVCMCGGGGLHLGASA